MFKVAQNTKFDNTVQQDKSRGYHAGPAQKLLFPDTSKGYPKEFETIEQKFEPLDLKYPELKEENINARKMNEREEQRVRDEIQYQVDYAEKHPYKTPKSEAEAAELKKYLTDNGITDVLKGKVLAKYEQLRQKSIEFYAVYKEANQFASTEYEIKTDGTYEELFREFPNLVVNELAKGVGKLFGIHATSEEISKAFKNPINIFTIHSLNYQRKIQEMDNLIKYMDDIIKDYTHRKKLLKNLGKNLNSEVESFISNPHWQKFLTWMDEYFPYHKEQFVKEAIERVNKETASQKTEYDRITFGDLVKFKTFKSIHEKAQNFATLGLKRTVQQSAEHKIKHELGNQIAQRVSTRVNSIIDFVEGLEYSMTAEEKVSHLINFCRKKYNIDLRAVFTFAQNVNKKRHTNYSTLAGEATAASKEENELYLININKHFLDKFLESLKINFSRFITAGSGKKINYEDNRSFNNYIETYVQGLGASKYNHFVDLEGMQKALILNARDFEQLANQFVFNNIIVSIPGFDSKYSFMREYESETLPTFGGIRQILESNDGKFSIEAFTNFAHSHVPFVPKEILFTAIRTLFKDLDSRAINRLEYIKGTNYQNTLKVIINILTKNNKLEHNSFLKLFKMLEHYQGIFSRMRANLPKNFTDEDTVFIMSDVVRNLNTMDTDLVNLEEFTKFIHNEAGELSDEIVKKIIANKNFVNFTKVGIVRKLFKAYAQIKNMKGVDHIYEQYGSIIKDLIEREFISSNFKENLTGIQEFFESDKEISPKSPEFNSLFEGASRLESDLATIQMGDALKDMIKDYTPKDENVFKLDLALNDNIRFRVLKDKDPRIMRIGIETDCCQRIGGVGEVAARDSFINPLSSVLVLEWRNPNEPDEWLLLAQSYFHYVPAEHGYILDNVESNARNVSTFRATTNISLEELYALFAQEIRNKLGAKYLLSGKNYSKIEQNKFKTDKRYKDPRHFDDRALTERNKDHYSDFDESNSIDLLAPKFNINNIQNKISRAHEQIRNFIKAILYPSALIKQAQADTTQAKQITPVPSQDIKTLQGVKSSVFGPQSWIYINQFMNELNVALVDLAGTQKLGNQTVNFQTVVKNPTGETRFTGGLKSLFQISTLLWSVVATSRNQPYSIDEAKNFANQLLTTVNSSNFPEPKAQTIKPKLSSILNNWLAILK